MQQVSDIPPAAAPPAPSGRDTPPPLDRPEQTEYVHPIAPWITPLVTLFVALLLQRLIAPLFGDYVERIAINCGIAVVMAVSLNIVNGYTGQFSIGHAAFFAIGGYASGLVSYYAAIEMYNWSNVSSGPMSFIWIAGTIFGGLVAAAAGWLVGLPSLRLRGDYLAIVTLGFGEILRVLLQQTNTQLYSKDEIHAAGWRQLLPPPVGGALGFINLPKLTSVFWVSIAVGLTLIVAWRLKRSTFGRAMIAIRENEIAAESMGVNVASLKVWAFVIAAFFAGIAGSLYAHTAGTTLQPTAGGFQASFDYVIMVVLGGLGSISGATLAAILLTIAPEWLREPTHLWAPLLACMIFRFFLWPVLADYIYDPAAFWRLPQTAATWFNSTANKPETLLGRIALQLIVWPTERIKAAAWWVGSIALVEAAWYLSHYYGINLGDYRMIIYALILIAMMILRPAGLFGTSEVTDLFRRREAAAVGPTGGFEVMRK